MIDDENKSRDRLFAQKDLLDGGEDRFNFVDIRIVNKLVPKCSADGPAALHGVMLRDGPHLVECGPREVLEEQVLHLAHRSVLAPRAGSGSRFALLAGSKFLLQSEDEGPDGPGIEPGNDGGDGTWLAGQDVGGFKELVYSRNVLEQVVLDGALKDGEEESVVDVLHDLAGVSGIILGQIHVQDSHTPGSGVLLLVIHSLPDVADLSLLLL
jgi:hypothetical protein